VNVISSIAVRDVTSNPPHRDLLHGDAIPTKYLTRGTFPFSTNKHTSSDRDRTRKSYVPAGARRYVVTNRFRDIQGRASEHMSPHIDEGGAAPVEYVHR
jgi:hypothetical protein